MTIISIIWFVSGVMAFLLNKMVSKSFLPTNMTEKFVFCLSFGWVALIWTIVELFETIICKLMGSEV